MEVFHVESDRTDLVVITLQEYRELLINNTKNEELSAQRLRSWYEEKTLNENLCKKIDDLKNQVEELHAKLDIARRDADCEREQLAKEDLTLSNFIPSDKSFDSQIGVMLDA